MNIQIFRSKNNLIQLKRELQGINLRKVCPANVKPYDLQDLIENDNTSEILHVHQVQKTTQLHAVRPHLE